MHNHFASGEAAMTALHSDIRLLIQSNSKPPVLYIIYPAYLGAPFVMYFHYSYALQALVFKTEVKTNSTLVR